MRTERSRSDDDGVASDGEGRAASISSADDDYEQTEEDVVDWKLIVPKWQRGFESSTEAHKKWSMKQIRVNSSFFFLSLLSVFFLQVVDFSGFFTRPLLSAFVCVYFTREMIAFQHLGIHSNPMWLFRFAVGSLPYAGSPPIQRFCIVYCLFMRTRPITYAIQFGNRMVFF